MFKTMEKNINQISDNKLAWLLFNEEDRIFAVIRCEEQHLERLAQAVAKEHGVERPQTGVIPFYEQRETLPSVVRLAR